MKFYFSASVLVPLTFWVTILLNRKNVAISFLSVTRFWCFSFYYSYSNRALLFTYFAISVSVTVNWKNIAARHSSVIKNKWTMLWVVALRMLPVIILYNTLVCRAWSWTWHDFSDSVTCWCHALTAINGESSSALVSTPCDTPSISGTAKNGKRQLTKK